MSALQSSTNPLFIKAQISRDDKELREIIKEAMDQHTPKSSSPSSSSSTKTPSKPRATGRKKPAPPPHAEPQKAVLMEVEPQFYGNFKGTPKGAPIVKKYPFSPPRNSWHRPAAGV
jgi:DNA polymerase gamma 1